MSFNSPSYLYRNRHGVFYFRVVIPKDLRHYFTHKREIKRSLKTENKHVALKLARIYMVDFDKLLAEIESGETRIGSLITLSNVKLAGGNTIEKVVIDQDSSEDERKTAIGFLQLTEQTKFLSNTLNNIPPKVSEKTFETICDEYIVDKSAVMKWKKSTLNEKIAQLNLLKRIMGGDRDISSIDRSVLNDFKHTLLKLPSNLNKSPDYRDKSITEILECNDIQLMELNTSSKYLSLAVSVLDWATDNDYLPKKITNNFSIVKDKAATRKGFSSKNLDDMFGSHKVENFDKIYKFWVPLIGLYTGARLNEICQMDVTDISMVDSTHVFLMMYNEENEENEEN